MASNEGFKSVVGGWQCLFCGAVVSDPYKPRHEHIDCDPQASALAIHLGVDVHCIEETRHSSDTYECEHEPGEWRVLTEREREKAADEALESYIDECIMPAVENEALKQYFDRAAWKRDALISDGYGHTLSPYDGAEEEEKIDGVWYFIYRVN